MGAIAFAVHVRAVAMHYGVSVLLHTSPCPGEHREWVDALLHADKEYFTAHKQPLFT